MYEWSYSTRNLELADEICNESIRLYREENSVRLAVGGSGSENGPVEKLLDRWRDELKKSRAKWARMYPEKGLSEGGRGVDCVLVLQGCVHLLYCTVHIL